MGRWTRARAGWVVAGAMLVAGVVLVVPAHADDRMLLPDLRQAPIGCAAGYAGDPSRCTDWDVCPVADPANPSAPCVTSGPIKAVRLRFTTSEENVGAGPLLVYGHRDDTSTSKMKVRQALQSGEHGAIPGSFTAAQHPIPATMYYEPATAHQHWHLLGFDRFQLLGQDGKALVVDKKTGFCLGDRYQAQGTDGLTHLPQDGTPEGDLAAVLAENRCQHHTPSATDVTAGISVGQGDNYDYTVDFQWLDLTTVDSGRYTVVNTANPDRSLLESNYDNNSSSMSISLQWPGGATTAPKVITAAPTVTLLNSCPGTARCAPRKASAGQR